MKERDRRIDGERNTHLQRYMEIEYTEKYELRVTEIGGMEE